MLNLHTHTTRCGHAEGTDREYIEAALKAGYTEFGFADHSPIDFREMFQGNPRLRKEEVYSYFEELNSLRKEYEKDIVIHIGFETEFYTDIFEDNLKTFRDAGIEYLIQGQHFTTFADGKVVPSAMPSDNIAYLENYLDLLRGGIKSGAFTYLAHPDLIHYTGPEEIYIERMTAFLQDVKASGMQLEFNRLGYFDQRNYPDERFWKIAGSLGIPAVIGLDAHYPWAFTDLDTISRIREYLSGLGVEIRQPVIRPL